MKFRAWDIETESYLVSGFDVRIDGNGYIYRRIWGESSWARTTSLIIEFWSGVEEIYAGDVVGFSPRNGRILFQDGTFKIRFSEGNIATSPKQCPIEGHRHGLEVIGNIHENPDLVDKDKD